MSNIYKYFDYNMKKFYTDGMTSETKIHYSLLNIVEYYFNNGFYENATQSKLINIEILFFNNFL